MKKFNTIGHIAIFIATFGLGLNTVISKAFLPEYMTATGLTLVRFIGGTVLFWLTSLFIKREEINKRDLFHLFLASAFGIVLTQTTFLYGLERTSPIDASLIITILPLITMFFAAAYLKEPITKLKIVGVAIGASGALWLTFRSGFLSSQTPYWVEGGRTFYGDLLCLLSIIFYAGFLVFFKKLMGKYNPVNIMKWMFLFATLMCIPFGYKDLLAIDFPGLPNAVCWRLLYIVVGATFICYLLFPIAIRYLRPTTISMYNFQEPFITAIAAIFIGLDKLSADRFIAAFLIFFGIYLVSKSKSKAEAEAAE
jgi:drug/metabolite transporter (DMT)-like permease